MFDFDRVVDRHGSWSTQWDFVADRFGQQDLLPFTISDMDIPTAPAVIDALQQRINHGILGYSRWQHADFLDAVSSWYQQRFTLEVDRQQIVWGPSVIYMAAQTIRHWSQPGDGVALHTPAYDAFYQVIAANQRRMYPVPLSLRQGEWHCDWEALESALAQPECKILLLCSPHNPTGKVWSRAELETMAQLCERHQVRVISDEIHMDMLMADSRHIPWSSVGRGHWALFTSASKSFNIPALTGAYGFISERQDRAAWFQALKNADGLSSPALLAVAAHIAAYRHGAEWLDALRDYLRANLCHVACRLNAAFPALQWQPPQATYLAWIDINPLNIDEQRLQRVLIEQQKVAMMPGSTYGAQSRGWLRFNVGCPRSKVDAGLDRLIAALHYCQAND